MSVTGVLLRLISIIAFFLLCVYLIILYMRNQREAMTNMEAASIMPILYDSSLTNKNKITDLLGIPVNDVSYNDILNTPNTDADTIISSIKNYIGASVTFHTSPPSTQTNTPTASPTMSSSSSTPAVTDATTTQPTTLSITQKPFKERIQENMAMAKK